MHVTISAIVYAVNAEDAIRVAENIFDDLTSEGGPFDYHTLLDDQNNTHAIYLADSPEGKRLIEEGWEASRDEFLKNIEHLRFVFNHFTNEEILENLCVPNDIESANEETKEFYAPLAMKLKTLPEEKIRPVQSLVKYRLSSTGSYKGPSWWLYDSDGEAIRDSQHLDDALNKWPTLGDYKKLNTYVVPADIHF
jgi:hypothetical protein